MNSCPKVAFTTNRTGPRSKERGGTKGVKSSVVEVMVVGRFPERLYE